MRARTWWLQHERVREKVHDLVGVRVKQDQRPAMM
jgi:hypothetical protein